MKNPTLEDIKKMDVDMLHRLMAFNLHEAAQAVADCFQVLAEEIEALKLEMKGR